jgi:exonuclease VII large subunit
MATPSQAELNENIGRAVQQIQAAQAPRPAPPASTMETGFRTVAPAPAPAVVPAPAATTYAPGIARPRPVSRRTRATRKNKNATSSALTRSIKAQKIRETFDKEIKELEAKEDKMKKATEAASRSLLQRSKEAKKQALKTTKLFKKKKAEIERRISKKKERRSNLLQRRLTARREKPLAEIRKASMTPPDVKVEMGGRR